MLALCVGMEPTNIYGSQWPGPLPLGPGVGSAGCFHELPQELRQGQTTQHELAIDFWEKMVAGHVTLAANSAMLMKLRR